MSVDVSIVVPVFNEVENIEALHREIRAAAEQSGRSFEVIYVDDGSDDGSDRVLRALQQGDSAVRVVRLARNYGQTAALASGFDACRGDVVVTLDGDRQNDPAEIPGLLKKLDEGYDVVTGWRLDRQDAFWSRRFPSMIANYLIGRITGVRLHDYGCTLRAMRRPIVRELRLYGEMHRFIPALAGDLGARILETPVNHRPRVAGTSKYGISRVGRVVLDLMAVKFLSSYSTRPIHVFGSIGLAASTLGVAITGILGFEKIFLGHPLADRPMLWLGILLTIMGLQFVTMGLLGELLVRTYHESQDKPVYRVAYVLENAD